MKNLHVVNVDPSNLRSEKVALTICTPNYSQIGFRTQEDSMGPKSIRRRQHQSKKQLEKTDQVKQTRQCISLPNYRGAPPPV